MPKLFKRKLMYSVIIALFSNGVYVTHGYAQQANKEEGKSVAPALSVVTVTSQKREETVQEIPLTVNVIDGQTFQDSTAGLTATEIVRYTPSFSAATLDGHGFPRWFLRGVGTPLPSLDNISPIGYYQDEVYLGPIYLSGGPIYDLERVEVLPGPQGTLWGKNSPGGAIHIISKKPQFKREGYVKGTIGNYNRRVFQGAVNEVLVEDKLATRFSFTSEDRNQFITNDVQGTGKLKDQAFRWQLLGNVTDNFDALFNVHYRKFKQDNNTSYVQYGPAGAVDAYGNPLRTFGDRVFSSAAPINSNHEQTGAVATLNWHLNNGYTLTSITGYEKLDRTALDGTTVPQQVSRSRSEDQAEQFTQELRLSSPREDRLNWITGLHYYQDKLNHFDASGNLSVPDLDPSVSPAYSNKLWSGTTKSLGIFGSLTYNATDRFAVTTGLRWSKETKDIDVLNQRATGTVSYNNLDQWWNAGSVNNPLTTTLEKTDKKTWTELTWDFTPEYKINDNILAYIRVAKGFRGGGFLTSDYGNFNPEYIRSYELGVKSQWLDGRLIANATVFQYNYSDILVNTLVWDAIRNQATTKMTNAAKATIRGAEFQIRALPTSNFELGFSVGLLDAKYDEYKNGTADYSGHKFQRAPSVTGVFNAQYTVPLESGSKLIFAGDVNTRSNHHFNVASYQTNPVYLHGGYTLANVRAIYEFNKSTQISAFVDNVTDKTYWQATYPSSPTNVGYALGAPRTYGVSLQYKW
jgi:iron complex outermembrane receptor protein